MRRPGRISFVCSTGKVEFILTLNPNRKQFGMKTRAFALTVLIMGSLVSCSNLKKLKLEHDQSGTRVETELLPQDPGIQVDSLLGP